MSLLPDSRPREIKNRVSIGGVIYVPIYCANCGVDGGGVPEEHMTFAFYLCNPCADKWGRIANTYMEPDAVFFEKVKQAQLEKHGRLLTDIELAKTLEDSQSDLAKLAKEAPKGR